jgi:predicted ThiF/HesA family dinucleotide-utilizing enzyme
MAVTINVNVLFVGPFRFGVWINIDMPNPFKGGQGILKSCDNRRHDGSDVLLRHFGDRVRRLFYSNKFYFINKLECAILGASADNYDIAAKFPRDPQVWLHTFETPD